MSKRLDYNGKTYEFVANTTYGELYKIYGDEIDDVFGCYDDEAFAELIKKTGGKTPCPLEIEVDFLDLGDKVIRVFENVMGDEEYDLYELIKEESNEQD